MNEHQTHTQAGTFHLRCVVCKVELKKLLGQASASTIDAMASPSVNEKTGVISQNGTVLVRSKIEALKAEGLSIATLFDR